MVVYGVVVFLIAPYDQNYDNPINFNTIRITTAP
jgi:hypothetical protein